MTDQELQKLEDKKFLAHSKDRKANTDVLSKKLNDLKPLEEVKVSNFPEPIKEVKVELTGIEVITLKGDKGETPTEEELLTLIQPLIPEPIPGKDGHTPTQTELKRIIKPLIPKPIKGEKGAPGADSSVPGPQGDPGKDGSPDTAQQILKKLQSLKDAWLEVKSIKGLDKLLNEAGNDWLNQAKGFVPRALASLYDVDIRNVTNGQALVWDSTSNKWVSGTVAAAVTTTNFVENEVVSGSGTSFTLTNTPIVGSVHLFGAGQRLVLTTDYSILGSVITTINSWNAGDVIADYRK